MKNQRSIPRIEVDAEELSRDRAKIFSSKFHLLPLGLYLLFLIIAANNLTASAFKEFEISCINGSLSTSQRSFNFLDLYFFFSVYRGHSPFSEFPDKAFVFLV